MRTLKMRLVRLLGSLLLMGSIACEESRDDAISELDSLRIVAVKADSPFAQPSSDVELEMLVNDASPAAVAKDGTKRAVRLLWLGGCVNPEGDLYYRCYPGLRDSLSKVSDEALNAGLETSATTNAKVGFGANYRLRMPSDVISSRPVARGVAHPYGVVMVFYAACAGELRVERDAKAENAYPVGCYHPNTGKPLSQADFEFGFYPVYAYDSLRNHVPRIKSAGFDSIDQGSPCAKAEDCEKDATCGSTGVCIPRVSACRSGKDCKEYRFELAVDESSVEPATSAYITEAVARPETLWVSYYSDYGAFDQDARIVYDAASGSTDEYFGLWSPSVGEKSPSTPREAHLYAVVRDSRGGVTWVTQDVYVE